MFASKRLRAVLAAAVISLAGAAAAAVPAAAGTLAGGPAPGGPTPGSEGPAGAPALLPNGHVATAPAPVSGTSPGCVGAPYGPNSYAPPLGSAKTVALTFDDGPGPSTAAIISMLHTYGVTATLFNIGQNSAANPSLVRQEAAEGFMVGNHTWSHPLNMNALPASTQATEIGQATAEQQSLIGWGPCAFRPPGGNYNSTTLTLARQRGMKFWLWSVDTEDWKAAGSSSPYWVNRIISLAESEGGTQQHPVVLMHNAASGDPATVKALSTIISYFRSHGYTFVNLAGSTGLGYRVQASAGGVYSYQATGYGSAAGTLGTAAAVGLATDPDTGGYWILKSNGGVAAYNAPWYGSLTGKVPAGQQVTAIAASRGGYLVLTSNGAVYGFGAPTYGSAAGTLGTARAVGLAADPDTGGYWILKSNGGVAAYNAPWYGSLTGKMPAGQTVTAIAASHGGYLVLTSNGAVYGFGAPTYGSAAGTLGTATAVGLATAPATGGYWILKSNGGVAAYNAPWYGSLTGKVPAGQRMTAIAGV